MQVVILCNDRYKDEWISPTHAADIVYIENREDFFKYPEAAAYIDLRFENKKQELQLLQQLLPGIVIIHSVLHTLDATHGSFIRINAWPGSATNTIEAACLDEALKERATKIFSLLDKKPEWLPDEPGFVTARVISMIINEAFYALEDGVSTKSEIDTAMKLGTNYPYGPF